ncbi:hypothetical protein QRD43_20440 [Pelomonas sp. APW6]|uniref:Uncharacterized protein n=1 Tax=Roseateles subflavus TaxID=3053353 RepID=A0ABT7LN31_9BURK|nr:hypothetical protein [Pelomonas sp. APW6]MDL5034282.1 hypothetical protein [Pelomonas sp. APW6]
MIDLTAKPRVSSPGQLGKLRRFFRQLAAGAMLAVFAAGVAPAFAQPSPSPCDQIKNALANGKSSANGVIAGSEASTKEATTNARACLEKIQNAISKMIPGMPSITPADFQQLLDAMMTRACQIVTTQIDSAGNVIQGTVSGASNRYIGDVNSAVNNATGGMLGGNVINTGQNVPITGIPGSGSNANPRAAPQPAAPRPDIWERLQCALSPSCK